MAEHWSMRIPKAWWKVPRPIRAGVCEVACFLWFLVLIAWITVEQLVAGALRFIAAPFTGAIEAYHEWQFGRVNVGLRERYEHDGTSVEITR